MEKLLSQIEKYFIYTFIFLFPIFVVSTSVNPFVVPKLAVLAFGIAGVLLIRSVRIIVSGKLDFSIGTFDFPVALIGLSYLLSLILRTPNKMEGLLLPGTATAVICAVILYFIINQYKAEEKRNMGTVLLASSSVFAAMTLLAFTGILGKIPQLPAYFRAQGFTPEGGFLPAAIFLGVMLPQGVAYLLSEKDAAKKALSGVALAVITLALAISIYNLLPGRPFSPRFPGFDVSWSVAVDSLKESPLLGSGPGNYLTAFNRFRPFSYNQTDLWAVKFATARNFYLTAFTETGMLGAAGIILLLVSMYKAAKRDIKEKTMVHWGFAATAGMISLVSMAVILAFFPATTLLIVTFFFLLALSAKTHSTSLKLTTVGESAPNSPSGQALTGQMVASKLPALLLTVPVFVIVILFAIRAARVLAAEYTFKKAIDALASNDASRTYDTMRDSIRLEPRVDRYHATFARINLALANSIAQRAAAAGQQATKGVEGEATQPAQISDADRATITTLIQQAISEGKATVSLNPLRSGNWEVLAQIYRAVIPLAQGADAFASQTYRQAVALDPLNPTLRIALGGVHYSRGDFENAVDIFQLAAQAKPDMANAHYNLAFALRDSGKLDRAISEMTLVLSLVDRNSNDYEVAQKALADMQAKKKELATAGDALTSPQTPTAPQIEPPVDLPAESEPPAAPLTPTPTSAEISPSPTAIPAP